MTTKYYASLVGPLLGAYYPLPFEDENDNRVALNTSRLKSLWCSVYTYEQVIENVDRFGEGPILDDSFAEKLDYDSFVVEQARENRGELVELTPFEAQQVREVLDD
jgi:hypothetical protein